MKKAIFFFITSQVAVVTAAILKTLEHSGGFIRPLYLTVALASIIPFVLSMRIFILGHMRAMREARRTIHERFVPRVN
jgi:hypothetical protein